MGFTGLIYVLKDPKSGRHVRKGTGIICSNPAFAQHVRTCPGNHVHATVSGSDLCQHAAKYTPQFVRAMWTCLVPPPQEPAASRLDWEALGCECLAAAKVPRARRSKYVIVELPGAIFRLHRSGANGCWMGRRREWR